MKKNVLRILAGVMTVFMMFAMTACTPPAEQNEIEQPEAPVLTEAEQAVAAYVEASKEQIEQLNTDETFNISIEAEGTKVVYKYTYKEFENLSDDQIAIMKKALEDEMAKNKETFSTTLATIKTEEANISALVFEYYEKSGKLIASTEISE